MLNGNKRVNMVHVDDIIAATLQCLITPRPEERLNVAGHNFRLSQLIAHCKHPEVPDGPDTDLTSKYVWELVEPRLRLGLPLMMAPLIATDDGASDRHADGL